MRSLERIQNFSVHKFTNLTCMNMYQISFVLILNFYRRYDLAESQGAMIRGASRRFGVRHSIYLNATVHVAPVLGLFRCSQAAAKPAGDKKQCSVHAPTKEKGKKQIFEVKNEKKKKEIE